MNNFSESLQEVLKHEGGFVNHPNDPGGPTNKGVTLANFRTYVKPNATIEDLKKITTDQLETFYRKNYWNVVLGDQLPSGIDYVVFDFAVNSGPSRAVKHLQAALGVPSDGVVGPVTLKAAEAADRKEVISSISASRQKFVEGLKTFKTFGKGWTTRIKDVKAKGLDLVDQKPVIELPETGGWALLLQIILRLLGLR